MVLCLISCSHVENALAALGMGRSQIAPITQSDRNPWVRDGNVGVFTALDVTRDPANCCDAGRLANTICASRDPRTKYVTWDRRITIVNSPEGMLS